MIWTLVQSSWFYSLVGLGVGVLLSLARRRLLQTRGTNPKSETRAEPGRSIRNPRFKMDSAGVVLSLSKGSLTRFFSGVNVQPSDVWLTMVTSAGFVGLWLRYGPSTQTVVLSTHYSVLLLVFVLDIEHRWVPNVLLLPAAILALVVSVLTGHPPLAGALLGGAAGFVWFYLTAIAYRGALGGGDVKLAGLIGLMTGFPGVLTALTLGILIGGAGAALLVISGKKTCKSYIPYAPFLVTGAFLTLVFGRQIASRFPVVSGW